MYEWCFRARQVSFKVGLEDAELIGSADTCPGLGLQDHMV